MQIDLTAEQREFIRHAVETGRVSAPEEMVQEALALWIERERERMEVLAALDAADASLARSEGREITEQSMRDLAGEVHRRGLARLAEDQPNRP